ncbi:MAG TPA: oligosaccharide flippase family protein [Blastocatellia bacterium]|jgi:O-antigen/teichoic acid export membrane protein|nr:oligosaccharide flippase family protein [Blastocatellia bacterium]
MPAINNEVDEKGSSLTARASWYLCAKVLAFAFSFALPLLLVRRLSQHEFGVYKQIFLVVGTAITTLPIGFGMSAFYFLPRERERRGQIVFNILMFYSVMGGLACLALALYPTALAAIFNDAEFLEYAPLVGLVIFLWAASSFLEIVVIANQEVKLATVLIVAAQFTKALILLAAAVSFGSVKSLIYAAIIQGALQAVILLSYLRARFGHFWRGFDWSVMRMQMAYALPFGFASLVLRANSELHNYFVSYRFGAAEYAIYSIGCFNILLVDILADSVGSVMIPRVSYLQSLDRRQEIIELMARMMRKLAAVLFPVYVFLMIAGREFITTLFTERYLASWPIFAVNLTLVPLAILVSAYDPVMRAYAEHRYFLIKVRVVLIAILFIALSFGTSRFGLLGAISAVVGVSVIERFVTAFKSGIILGLTARDILLFRDVGRLAIAATAAGAVAAIARWPLLGSSPIIILAACGGLYFITYFTLVVAMGILTADERRSIRRRVTLVQRFAHWKRAAAPVGEEV